MDERLQKFLAHAGVASRRQAEEMMAEGRVTVNGKVVTTMGSRIDPQNDAVKVDGKRIKTEILTYVLLNKPRGTICTMDDPEGRPRVTDLIKGVHARLYPVGRLDFDTSGALLLTNDGELANQLTHPRHNITRTYVAKVKGQPTESNIKKMCSGLYIDGRKTRPAEVSIRGKREKNCYLELILKEGRNKQVKRMCQAVGHPVIRLDRESFGFLEVSGLQPGQWRHLEASEVLKLKAGATVFTNEKSAAKRKPRAKTKKAAKAS